MKNKKILSVILLVVVITTLFLPFMAFNSGASYDEFGLEMYNNNYSGTRWRLDVNIPAGLGYVNGLFNVYVDNTSYNSKTCIYFGYYYDYDANTLVTAENYLSLYSISVYGSINSYHNIDISSISNDLRINVLYMDVEVSNVNRFNSIFKTYLKLLFVQNENNIPIKFIIESDYPSNFDISKFFLYFSGNDLINVSGKILNTDFVYGRTEFVLNTSLCPAQYDTENQYYYYNLQTRYTGYIPYISFYDYEGNFIDRVELDGQYSEIYLTSKQYGVITYEYNEDSTTTVTSIRLILRDEEFGDVLGSYYDNGYDVGYDNGEEVGYEKGLNDDLGKDVVIGALSAPHVFLDAIVLFEVGSIPISLWDIFSTVLGVSLFIWFLKMFSGG